jgi:hypothetical protein
VTGWRESGRCHLDQFEWNLSGHYDDIKRLTQTLRELLIKNGVKALPWGLGRYLWNQVSVASSFTRICLGGALAGQGCQKTIVQKV